MEKNKSRLLIIGLILLILNGCFDNNQVITDKNHVLNDLRLYFSKDTYKSHLLSHFPEIIKNDSFHFIEFPPGCPPTYNCSAQFGKVCLVLNKSDYQQDYAKLLKGQIIYRTNYKDSNIIINLIELRRKIFPIKKCNKYYKNKYPIPYFEGINFGLGGENVEKVVINDETYFSYTYTVPTDLKVYVISAEPGNFWKVDCNEKRPESLKEWKNGYSRGIAISEKEGLVVYWVMIW